MRCHHGHWQLLPASVRNTRTSIICRWSLSYQPAQSVNPCSLAMCVYSLSLLFELSVIACSHHWLKTVLSCPCRWCEHNWRQDKTVCLVSTQFPISKFSVVLSIFATEQLQIGNWVKTRQNCLVLSPILFTLPTWTGLDKTVHVGGLNKL